MENQTNKVSKLKADVSEVLMNAINRRDLNLINSKNGRVEWGNVEKTIHILIDEFVESGDS